MYAALICAFPTMQCNCKQHTRTDADRGEFRVSLQLPVRHAGRTGKQEQPPRHGTADAVVWRPADDDGGQGWHGTASILIPAGINAACTAGLLPLK